ncbi:MAG: hypothetical protein JXX14_26075 [Deltaproteobacteria bacterium]|nr:hypothetical protein [Deltaproteobacteria bacterium]
MFKQFSMPLIALAGFVLLCTAAAGCREDKKQKVFQPGTDDSASDTGTSTAIGDTGTSSEVTDSQPVSATDSVTATDTDNASGTDSDTAGGPVISVVSPVAPLTGQFTSDVIIATDQAEVICSATPDPTMQTPVDARSVKITVSSDLVTRSVSAAPAAQTGLYRGLVHVGDFNTGMVTISCDASDLASPPRSSMGEAISFIDHGPDITIFSPLDSSAHGSVLNLQFMVLASPLSEVDAGASPLLSTLEVHLGGVNITSLVTPVASQPNLYNGAIYFDDPIFDYTLDGINTIQIKVQNSRQPQPVTGEATVSFIADSKGPAIAPVSPLPGDLLGGQVAISATVADLSGVEIHSVVATIAGIHDVQLRKVNDDGLYSGLFDSRRLDSTMIYPNITIRAQDSLGNQNAQGYLVSLDNRPPLISLDPPRVRETRQNADSGLTECSWLFDPLGGFDPAGMDPLYSDAVDDGESVPQLFEIRARIEDRGNSLLWQSGHDVPIGGVNPDSVILYLLDDETGALIVDSNNDGFCDSINPLLLPSSAPMPGSEAVVIQMVGLQPAGISNFTGLPADAPAQPPFDTDPDSPETVCSSGSAAKRPTPICAASATTRIAPSVNGDATIFTVPPVNTDHCMGTPVDALATHLSDGWICAAVTATDTLGTPGVSAPVRICIDHDGDGAECPPWGTVTTENLPDCTGTYDPETETITAIPCLLRDAATLPDAGHPASWYFEDYPEYQLIYP